MVPSAHGDRTPLPPTFPDLRSLELFTSVCRLGSLSAAAVVHGIAQPSASARIRSLERQVGVSLLQRSATGSTPTHNGVLVAEWADRFLDAADELHVALGDAHPIAERWSPSPPATRSPSFCCPAGWGSGAARPIAAPNWRWSTPPRCSAGCRTATPSWGSSRPPEAWERSTVRRWAATSWSPSSPRPTGWPPVVGHCTRQSSRRSASCVGSPVRAPGTRWPTHSAQQEPNSPRRRSSLGSTSAVRGAVSGGAGLAVLSRLTVAADLESGSLTEVPISGLDLRRPLRAVWKPARLTPAGRALIEVAERW